MVDNRFWRWYDRGARVDFGANLLALFFDWRTWLFGIGSSVVTFIGTANQGWDPWAVWLAALAAGAFVAVIIIALRVLWSFKRSDAQTNHGSDKVDDELTRGITAEEPSADIDARTAYFQILESSKWRKEQNRTTDPEGLVYNWLEVRLDREIHKALRNSRLAAWGEESLPGTATTPEKPIPPETWDKAEIVFDRSSLPRTAAHFKGPTSLQLGRMAWVGVKFSRQQIFQLFPLESQNSDEWRPIFMAIQHIRERIGDTNSEKCWPAARLALRQAAYDKRVKMRGRKQLPENNPHSGSEYSEIFTDIDSDYWTNSDINALATSSDMQSHYHVDPQTASAWGKQGIYERNRYAELKINWTDVLREWP